MEQNKRFKTKPYAHQKGCLEKFGGREYFALNGEQGTGKTWIILNDVAELWAKHEVDTLLVFAPNGVHTNWVLKEIPTHLPDWVRVRYAAWYSSPSKKDKMALASVLDSTDSTELKIITMNWEALQHKKGQEFARQFCMRSRKLMIVGDETQRIKEPTATRTKNYLALKKFAHFRRNMSGTPITNGPFGAFSQYSFLDESILGTTSYFAFKAEYAQMEDPNSPKMLGLMKAKNLRRAPQIPMKDKQTGRAVYRNLDKLQKIIEPHTFRILKEECLDLPKKTYKTVWFEMTPEQKEIYKYAEDEFRLSLDGEVSTLTHLTLLGKLAQITSGYYLYPNTSEPVRIGSSNPKLELLVERVKDSLEDGHSVIVWARFRVEIEDIVVALREADPNLVQYHGGISGADRITAIDDFQSGKAKIFVSQQQAGGTGITLTAASRVYYFSNTFSLEDRLQSEDRCHRIGQGKFVSYTDILAKDSIDASIVGALANKQNISDIVTGDAFRKSLPKGKK